MDKEYINNFVTFLESIEPNSAKLIKQQLDHLKDTIISASKNIKHKTVKVNEIDIDENIAELIRLIWMANIDTNNSCENNNPSNYIWICFDTYFDFKKFMEIVTNDVDNFLFSRIVYSHDFEPDSWIYNFCMTDFKYCESDDDGSDDDGSDDDDSNNYDIDDIDNISNIDELEVSSIESENCKRIFGDPQISVRFPNKDKEFVINQLKKYLDV